MVGCTEAVLGPITLSITFLAMLVPMPKENPSLIVSIIDGLFRAGFCNTIDFISWFGTTDDFF